MPFKSKAQARLMFAKHPKIAKRWAKKTGKGRMKRLPARAHRRSRGGKGKKR